MDNPSLDPITAPLHGQLLYGQRGAAMDGDLYDVGAGFTRDQGKLAFQIAINARNRRSATAAIVHHASWIGLALERSLTP